MENPYSRFVDDFRAKLQWENEQSVQLTLKKKHITMLRNLIFQTMQHDEDPVLLETDKILHQALQKI
jgi:hypothetical protein